MGVPVAGLKAEEVPVQPSPACSAGSGQGSEPTPALRWVVTVPLCFLPGTMGFWGGRALNSALERRMMFFIPLSTR